MPSITYLLLLLETWNVIAQENLWVVKNDLNIDKDLHNIQLNRGFFTLIYLT